jgi:hypothetical protein
MAYERSSALFPAQVNSFRVRSQRRVRLATQLSLFKLKEDALTEVFELNPALN